MQRGARRTYETQRLLVRKRLAVAPPETVAELRAEFLRRARSKRLVYPYQAAFLSVRPSSIARRSLPKINA